jgi:hypothetical protein
MQSRNSASTPFLAILAGVLATMSAPAGVAAQDAQGLSAHHGKSNGLVRVVREVTEKYRDVTAATNDGYHLLFGCVSGPDRGAMGLHFVNLALVGDGVLDPAKPEIVIYEPQPDGRLRLIGADYLVFASAWHAANTDTPQLMGQLLHLFEAPNRFGLPDFYTLHVWAWRDNPDGTFTNWHPKVSCDAFTPPQ